MKKRLFLGLIVFAAAFPISAELICSGTVETVAYHANNRLMLKLSSMNNPVFFCSPDSEWAVAGTTYTTGPETCKTLFATFLAAKASKTPIGSVYFEGSDVPANCNSWGTWKSANILFFSY